MTTPFRDGTVSTTTSPSVLLADISEFQPNIADAAYLEWSKAIVIRALYGTAHDDAAWYGGQRRADLHAGGVEFLGIYQYLVAGQSGVAAAQAFHSLVGPIQKGEIFIADFEEGAKSALTDWYNEMVALYGEAIAPYLWTYSGLEFGESVGLAPWQWLADYTSVEPTVPAHILWQFTDAYSIPGVGTADCSIFHGTLAELVAMTYDNKPVTPVVPDPPKPFPPPTGVKAYSINLYITWDAQTIKGLTGYTVQTLNLNGTVFNQQVVTTNHATVVGLSLYTTYKFRVWPNGGPVAPQATEFQFTT
jgi:hypothetical protein